MNNSERCEKLAADVVEIREADTTMTIEKCFERLAGYNLGNDKPRTSWCHPCPDPLDDVWMIDADER